MRMLFNKPCLIVIIFYILYPLIGYTQKNGNWKIQPITIQTRWAKEVDPNKPLPEYPRPQMIRENNWQNLNGLWSYAITTKNAPKPNSFQGQILVPFPIESALSGVRKALSSTETLWYFRFFRITKKKGQRTLLHFGAVDWMATIYINGQEVGSHSGGYTEFTIDITAAIHNGKNELLVKVFDPTDKGIGPHGKQMLNPGNIYYTASSGIWQTVWLETVPQYYIEKLTFTPDIDKSELNVTIETPLESEVELTAFASGRTIANVKGTTRSSIRVPIKNAKLWSPDSPFLYDLEVKLSKNGKVLDQVRSYFGMRKINIQQDEKGIDRIFLNNQYYYNLGTLDQGFWPDGLYTPPTDSALQFDIMAIKAMGFNTIRKHIKVEPARWYYYTDKLGMLVWQDMVNPNQGLPEGSKAEFEKESFEIVSQLHNYPSISTWVLFNEKWGQYDQERLTRWMKQIDPSRIINGHSGEYLYVNNQLRSPSPNAYVGADMTDVHSYPNPMLSIKLPGKAQVCGEFGGIGVPISGHLWDDLTTGWGYDGLVTPVVMVKQYDQFTDSLKTLEKRGLSASIYTQPFDVESEQNGIITYDREIIKIPVSILQSINAKLWPITSNYATIARNLFKNAQIDTLNYTQRLEEYNNGRRDSLFLRGLMVTAFRNNDSITLSRLTVDYVKSIKQVFTYDNLKLLCKVTWTSKDTGFSIINTNRNKVNLELGRNTAENLLMSMIYHDYIAPFDKQEKPNWEQIEKEVAVKFGELGQERVWGNRMVYHYSRKEWQPFSKYYKLYFDRAIPNHRTFVNINNISWSIFENIVDTAVLNTAIKAVQYAVEKLDVDDADTIDTYANLLYKSGKKQLAISMERKALRLSNNKKEIFNNLKKMENDLPTW